MIFKGVKKIVRKRDGDDKRWTQRERDRERESRVQKKKGKAFEVNLLIGINSLIFNSIILAWEIKENRGKFLIGFAARNVVILNT